MLLNRRTLILAGLAVAAVSGCSVESKVEFLTGTAAYVAQNPDNPLARVAATASQQIGWRLLVQGNHTKNQLLSPASLCAAFRGWHHLGRGSQVRVGRFTLGGDE